MWKHIFTLFILKSSTEVTMTFSNPRSHFEVSWRGISPPQWQPILAKVHKMLAKKNNNPKTK